MYSTCGQTLGRQAGETDIADRRLTRAGHHLRGRGRQPWIPGIHLPGLTAPPHLLLAIYAARHMQPATAPKRRMGDCAGWRMCTAAFLVPDVPRLDDAQFTNYALHVVRGWTNTSGKSEPRIWHLPMDTRLPDVLQHAPLSLRFSWFHGHFHYLISSSLKHNISLPSHSCIYTYAIVIQLRTGQFLLAVLTSHGVAFQPPIPPHSLQLMVFYDWRYETPPPYWPPRSRTR